MSVTGINGVSGVNGTNDAQSLDMIVLGLNSGTAMDGIDCALYHFKQQSPTSPLELKILNYDELPVPQKMKKPVLRMLRETATTPCAIAQLNVQLGEYSQTIWLLSIPKPGEPRSSFTLGEGAIISGMTGITTVTEFRTCEQAVGRQGAPLVALLDGILLHHPTKWEICQNIGGTANLDYDKDAKWARQGNVDQEVVDKFLDSHPYINLAPPKTTGREVFDDEEAQALIDECLSKGASRYDTVATITRITAQNIVRQYYTFGPKAAFEKPVDIHMCGGGSLDPTITDYLQRELPNTRVLPLDESCVPSSAKEAVTFALQGMEAILGRPLAVPTNSDTLKPPFITGKTAPGKEWRRLMTRARDFSNGKDLP